MDIIELLRDIGLFGLAVGGLSWIAKILGEKYLERKMSLFESDLEQSLEKYKMELQIIFNKETKIYNDRLEILRELYARIVDLDIKTNDMTRILKEVEKDFEKEEWDRIKVTGESYNNFSVYYAKNKIMFSTSTCKLIEEIRGEYFESLLDYSFEQRLKFRSELTAEKMKKARERVVENIPKALEDLENEFRVLIGIE